MKFCPLLRNDCMQNRCALWVNYHCGLMNEKPIHVDPEIDTMITKVMNLPVKEEIIDDDKKAALDNLYGV